MISRTIFTDILLIAFLTALQIFILNRITLFGEYTPVLYPVFVMFYPFFRNRYHFLVLSFVLGLSIDAFLGTWGINAFATTAVAYYRTLIFRTSTDTTTDFFTFSTLQWPQFLLFIISAIFFHQLLVQYIEFFKLSRILEILLNIIISTLFSFVFILLYALIFKIKQRI
ncbi:MULTISPECIES: rod shape-determining protein MreD [Chryseobacterium group]|uniref:rod shape-determining protein MreD n=1 Tax=Chryseobacterium group TaxID=2782232 RepID=UPI0012AA54D1|nr:MULTISPECIES: rod shape-determining protein MreD [Chryseobacterium group]MDF0719249.1 rod shape-determining protein MreD [Kaistella sp. PBT33-4]QFG52086.1 rod shape-determining protein MreD [Chryseobacterium sp.]